MERDDRQAKMTARLHLFGDNLWTADGPVVSLFGFDYPTRMAVIRLESGQLFVWSPIALAADLREEVDRLGPVGFLVSPNRLHHLYLSEWRAAYPAARLYASPGLRRKRRDIAFDADLGDAPDPAWATDIDQVLMRGSLIMTEVVFFHRASRAVLFADLIENLPHDWFHGWRAVMARLDGILAPNPGAPREWRASFVNRAAARTAVDRILAWPIDRVLIAHGGTATSEGHAFVRRAFDWLDPGG